MRNMGVFSLAIMGAVFLAGCSGPQTPSSSSAGAAHVPDPPAGKLDERGYIRNWLVLAPIYFGDKYNAEDIEKEQIPGEAGMMPRAGQMVKVQSDEGEAGAPNVVAKTLTWTPVATKEFFLDFNEFCGLESSESVGGYAAAYLECAEEIKDITLSFSTNDDGNLYFNGKSIWNYVGGRGLEEDSDAVENLTLHKGTNVVILKVWNDSNNWQGCLRVLKDGKPATGVKVRLAK